MKEVMWMWDARMGQRGKRRYRIANNAEEAVVLKLELEDGGDDAHAEVRGGGGVKVSGDVEEKGGRCAEESPLLQVGFVSGFCVTFISFSLSLLSSRPLYLTGY